MKQAPISHNQNNKPMLVCVTCDSTPKQCIATIRNSIFDGADAFLIDLGKLEAQYRNAEAMKQIFAYCEDRPVITMAYRTSLGEEMNDEQIGEYLLESVRAGAAMCDVMGDLYHASPLELSRDRTSIAKQKKLISHIHKAGGKVMMSSHTWAFLSEEESLKHAKALASRGADMIKLAVIARNPEEEWAAYQATHLLDAQLGIPFLHVCMGQYGKRHRMYAPLFGSSLILCVQQYTEKSHKEQVLLKSARVIVDNTDWGMARDPQLGTVHQS